MYKTINLIIISWNSKGLSNEIIKPPTTANNSLNLKLDYFSILKFRVSFEGSWLKTVIKPFTHNKIINFCVLYEIKLWPFHHSSKSTVRNSLFATVKLTKNADPDTRNFFIKKWRFCYKRNIWCWYELFWYNKEKDILILGKGVTQGLDDTTLTAEAKYSVLLNMKKYFV